jgi:hypothetical protein
MVDPGIGQAIVRWLNRWYRKHAKPHGKVDHYYRGIRMTRTTANRVIFLCFWLFLLSIVVAFFFVPDIFSGQPLFMKLLLRAGWLLMTILVLLGPLAAARDFAVITDDALIKPKLFGGETRVAWNDITSVRIEPDSNEVAFTTGDKKKCKISLAYDGWRDLLETAIKHLNPSLHYQLLVLLQNRDIKRMRPANKDSGVNL